MVLFGGELEKRLVNLGLMELHIQSVKAQVILEMEQHVYIMQNQQLDLLQQRFGKIETLG